MTESDPLISERVILAIDAGNTRIKWGVHDGHAWTAARAIATAQSGGLYEALRPALSVDADRLERRGAGRAGGHRARRGRGEDSRDDHPRAARTAGCGE